MITMDNHTNTTQKYVETFPCRPTTQTPERCHQCTQTHKIESSFSVQVFWAKAVSFDHSRIYNSTLYKLKCFVTLTHYLAGNYIVRIGYGVLSFLLIGVFIRFIAGDRCIGECQFGSSPFCGYDCFAARGTLCCLFLVKSGPVLWTFHSTSRYLAELLRFDNDYFNQNIQKNFVCAWLMCLLYGRCFWMYIY